MSEDATAGASRPELFRPAAVTAHTEAAGPGRSLPSSRRPLRRATTALAVGLLVAFSVGAVIQVDETAEGHWLRGPTERTVTVIVPVGALPRLHPGQPVGLSAGGTRSEAIVAGPAEPVRSGEDAGASASVLATLVGAGPGGAERGAAVVRLDRRRLLGLVGDSFGRGFGRA